VSDPHESHPRDDNSPASEAADVPEIIDAEVVDTTRREHAPPGAEVNMSAADAATFRQYQQFLEFQKFQEWQRQHGTAPTPEPPAARPWWKRALLLLRYKAVRRLLYFVVALVLIYTAIDHYFGGGGSHDRATESHVPGNENPAVSPVQGANPADPVKAVYSSIATNTPAVVCAEFTPQAGAEFAAASGAPDCPAAVRQLSSQVTNPTDYTDNAFMAFQFNPDAVTVANGQAEVPACRIVVAGGPHLGSFHLQQLPNRGWRIDGYQSPPAQCGPS
jgi:hypothetical protein